jgi:glucose/arabinose dehydrogenase
MRSQTSRATVSANRHIKNFIGIMLISLGLAHGRAANLPAGFTEFSVANGLTSPTAMEFAPDGRLFVCEQGGTLRVVKNFALLPTPFLTVTTAASNERGLLGLAFDPGFATNNFLYVYYTAFSPTTHNRVSRFTANGDVAVPGSELPILDLETLSAGNHNGGAIHFGRDGKLYVATGENAVPSYSQSLANRLGKLLRINTDGSIPTDNPFYQTATGANRAIWALGLRNPFTFAVQPGTGRIYINDVGGGSWEEVNEGVAGANYGWPNCEGNCNPPNPAFRNPVFAYPHNGGNITGCSITGGTFYDPVAHQFPAAFRSTYFFTDACGGWIRRLNPTNGVVSDFASGVAGPVDLKVSAEGRLYYLARNSGQVMAIEHTASGPALGIVREGATVHLLWPAPSTSYALESTTTLAAGSWSPVNATVLSANGQNRVIVNASGPRQFFRLRRP